MRRSAISWLVVFAMLIGGFVASIAALNADLYSAHGFVRTYLDALARKDSAAALAIPGVAVEGDDGLLNDATLGTLTTLDLVRDTENADGTHTVVFDYAIGGEAGRSEFHVQHSGTRFGVFNDWSFVASPISTVAVTVKNDDHFEVNGTELDEAGAYLVFTPGLYVVGHESTFLTAEPAPVAMTEPGTIVDAAITVKANDEFVSTVQSEVDGYLEDCAAQKVLQPTGCPFGFRVQDRIVSPPTWTIVQQPQVAVDPNGAGWMIPQAEAMARIDVDIRSLFDGTIDQVVEDVPFVVTGSIEILPDGSASITVSGIDPL